MADWQNILVLAAICGAGAYVLRASLIACGLVGGSDRKGCGGCAKCPSAQAASAQPAGAVQFVALLGTRRELISPLPRRGGEGEYY